MKRRSLASMFFWCCGRKDELDREDAVGDSFDAERLLSSAEEVVGGTKAAIVAKAQNVEQMIANPAAAWTSTGQPALQQATAVDTGKENHRPSVQEASVKAVTSETRTLDLPDRQKPEESSATKHLDAVTAAPVAATQAMENVVTGTPVEPVSQPAASPSAAGKGENIVNDIAAAAPAVQETAKAAAAAAISQKDSEASTSTGAGPSNPAGTPSPPKKTASKKKGGGKKGKKGNKK